MPAMLQVPFSSRFSIATAFRPRSRACTLAQVRPDFAATSSTKSLAGRGLLGCRPLCGARAGLFRARPRRFGAMLAGTGGPTIAVTGLAVYGCALLFADACGEAKQELSPLYVSEGAHFSLSSIATVVVPTRSTR
jgi:hypothetical protein